MAADANEREERSGSESDHDDAAALPRAELCASPEQYLQVAHYRQYLYRP